MKLSWLRRGLMALMLVLIGLRPTLPGGGYVESGNSNLDVLFVVDTTNSMMAEDYNGNSTRMAGAKADIAAVAEQLAGARFSLIGFDNTAYVSVPFTTDATAITGAAEVMDPVISAYANGTSIDAPMELMQNTLESAAKKTGRVRVVFYMGDGEQTLSNEPATFSGLKEFIDTGAVLGYGTEEGGRFRKVDHSGEPDEYEQGAVSMINEDNLRTIAEDIGLNYYYRDAPDDTSGITADIRPRIRQVASDRDVSVRQETYWIFAVILLGLLFWELWRMLDELFPRKGRRK